MAKTIVERIDDMDEESAKKAVWYLLQAGAKTMKCDKCGKCKKPSLGACMIKMLDAVEVIEKDEMG